MIIIGSKEEEEKLAGYEGAPDFALFSVLSLDTILLHICVRVCIMDACVSVCIN